MIDWEAQWRGHAPGFGDEGLPLGISFNGKELLLKAGPGFGDLSHSTTRLMLDGMREIVEGQWVIDVGCGSGILSLAARGLGALEVVGVDIEEEALRHAEENRVRNGVDGCAFHLPSKALPRFQQGVILMNMITSEQRVAFSSLHLENFCGHLRISGVLESQVEEALKMYPEWTFISEKKESGWSRLDFNR